MQACSACQVKALNSAETFGGVSSPNPLCNKGFVLTMRIEIYCPCHDSSAFSVMNNTQCNFVWCILGKGVSSASKDKYYEIAFNLIILFLYLEQQFSKLSLLL